MDYVTISDKILKQDKHNVSQEELFDYLTDIQYAIISSYEDEDIKQLKNILDNTRDIRKKITSDLRESENQKEICESKFVQTYNIFNELYRDSVEKKFISTQIDLLITINSKTRDIIYYMYNHVFVQHKDIKQNINISGSTLSNVLKRLETNKCITKIPIGKYSFYSLTVDTRAYVERNMKKEWQATDFDNFKTRSTQLTKERMEIDKNNYNSEKVLFENPSATYKQWMVKFQSLKIL